MDNREYWIKRFTIEGYEVQLTYAGKSLTISVYLDGKKEAEVISDSLDEVQLLGLLFDMTHDNIIPAETELATEYEN